MLPKFIKEINVPHKPGIYIYKDFENRILYVGKAVDLYHRVASYFVKNQTNTKTTQLVSMIHSVETIVVESELEALILEANLIKKYLPPFNIRLTDDKDYLYIKTTKEDFPRVLTGRKKDIVDAKKYFGPFPSSRTVKLTLKGLRRVFPWCNSPIKKGINKPCFYYHLGLCPGPCAGTIDKKNYNKNIRRLELLLEGKSSELTRELSKEMVVFSEKLEYENAGRVKRVLDGLSYLTQPNRTQMYLQNANFLEDERRLTLGELQRILGLPAVPNRIEAYDISNIQGENATGSMVVLTNGEIDKSQYRRFKIHISGKPNDVGMHKEMMQRRLKHFEWPLPDLFLIDGGIGQVRGVKSILINSNIPIYGLAKRMEWLYAPDGNIIKLPKESLALRLLQKIRDEAHRFAVAYHRKLRRAGSGILPEGKGLVK